SGLVSYGETEGYRSGDFTPSIFESQNGDLYATNGDYYSPYVNMFDGTQFSAIRVNAPVLGAGQGFWESVMLQGRGREWWMTTGAGLFRFASVKRIRDLSKLRPKAAFTVRQGLTNNNVHPLHEDSKGDLWFATWRPGMHELYRWERASNAVQRVSTAGAPSM